MIFIVIWVIASAIIAWAAENKTPGFWGIFFISLIFSPLIGIIVALVTPVKRDNTVEQQILLNQQQQLLNHQQQMSKTNQQSVSEELLKLKKLKDEGVIDDAEYQNLKNKLIAKFD